MAGDATFAAYPGLNRVDRIAAFESRALHAPTLGTHAPDEQDTSVLLDRFPTIVPWRGGERE